jgi:putative phosphonate metabolism protein
MRYAIYFTPGQHEPLAETATAWLGRNPFTGLTTPPPAVPPLSAAEVAFHTAATRRYGFHATLKAPFQLADGATEAALRSALDQFAHRTAQIRVSRLVLGRIDGFFALLPETPPPDLNRLANAVVEAFDSFRAPLSEVEIERRSPDSLRPAEFRNLHRWGYPYVFDAFRFHMSLTGRVPPGEDERVRAAIERMFGEMLSNPVAIDALTLFVEPEPGAPFMVKSRHVLMHHQERLTA